MALDCECRIPDYHGDDTWVRVDDAFDTENAVVRFAERMDRKDFELWMHEDEPREVWVRKIGVTDHMVYNVSFQAVKSFRAEVKSRD